MTNENTEDKKDELGDDDLDNVAGAGKPIGGGGGGGGRAMGDDPEDAGKPIGGGGGGGGR